MTVVRLGARRVERTRAGEARHADLPLDLGVIRLEVGVGDRPVGEAGAGNRAKDAALVEIDLVKAPEVGRVVQAPATDRAAIPERRLEFLKRGLLRRIVAKRLRVLDRVVGDAAEIPVLQLVVPEAAQRQSRTLFEHHDGEPALRQFPRDDSTRRAGADDDEVNGVRVSIRLRIHLLFDRSMTKPG
jgi:hypothetical protein